MTKKAEPKKLKKLAVKMTTVRDLAVPEQTAVRIQGGNSVGKKIVTSRG